MKKILLAIAIVITMGFSASAQRDGFFNSYDNIYGRDVMADPNDYIHMPSEGIGSTTNESAPLGTGLFIMTALGGAYMLKRREK